MKAYFYEGITSAHSVGSVINSNSLYLRVRESACVESPNLIIGCPLMPVNVGNNSCAYVQFGAIYVLDAWKFKMLVFKSCLEGLFPVYTFIREVRHDVSISELQTSKSDSLVQRDTPQPDEWSFLEELIERKLL